MEQPVVDGDHEGVFEELGQEEQGEQDDPGGGQVGAAGAPGDGGAVTHRLGHDVFIVTLLQGLLWDQDRNVQMFQSGGSV